MKTLPFILILVSHNLFAQSIKTYKGIYKGGNATYSYYEKDYERILDGSIFYEGENSVVTGKFKDNKRVGIWNYESKYIGSSTEKGYKTIVKGSYIDGEMNGLWVYTKSQEITGKLLETSKIKFNNGIPIDTFYYKQEHSGYYPKIEVKGVFDASGYFHNTWTSHYEKSGIPYEEIRKYNHGILYFLLERDLTDGRIIYKTDKTSFVDSIFNLINSSSDSVVLNEQTFLLVSPRNSTKHDVSFFRDDYLYDKYNDPQKFDNNRFYHRYSYPLKYAFTIWECIKADNCFWFDNSYSTSADQMNTMLPQRFIKKVDSKIESAIDARSLFTGKKSDSSNQGKPWGNPSLHNQDISQGSNAETKPLTIHSSNSSNENSLNNLGIYYNLAGRKHLSISKPINKSGLTGRLSIIIKVDKKGNVIDASYQSIGSGITDLELIRSAIKAAKLAKFESGENALDVQNGTITYNFVPE